MSTRNIVSRIRFWMMESDRWFLLIAASCLAVIAFVGVKSYQEQERQIGIIRENRARVIEVQGRMEEVAFWQRGAGDRQNELAEQIAEQRGQIGTLERLFTQIVRDRE